MPPLRSVALSMVVALAAPSAATAAPEGAHWQGSWQVRIAGEEYVWSLSADGSGRTYAYDSGNGKFAYGFEFYWDLQPGGDIHVRTANRLACEGGHLQSFAATPVEIRYQVLGPAQWRPRALGANHLVQFLRRLPPASPPAPCDGPG